MPPNEALVVEAVEVPARGLFFFLIVLVGLTALAGAACSNTIGAAGGGGGASCFGDELPIHISLSLRNVEARALTGSVNCVQAG